MTAQRDPDQLIRHFLLEGSERLHDQVYDAIRAEIEQQRQRVVIGPWRVPVMNKIVPIGVAAAAVIVALVVGTRLLGAPAKGDVGGAPSVRPSVAPSPSAAPSADSSPTPTVWVGLPKGPFTVTDSAVGVRTTIDIASPGWESLAEFDAVSKNDDGRDAPETVGASLLAWTWPAGTGINVYKDPCQWTTSVPPAPATTPQEIAAAFAAQAETDASAPVDVTVGGYAGKATTLRVPMSYDLPNATREEKFGACDSDAYAFYGVEGETGHARNAQGAGQIDELFILNVEGSIVILDVALSPSTPTELVEETRALARSATFKAP
ncbi:MAG TPA: hypothetical protein VFK35_01825 [Candidatus Limnocylindrales bacterium]|nr:hypothetical protein [Candidatus Limnocylindrales bacterium]